MSDDEKPVPDPQPKDQRIPIMMSAAEVRAIDDWRFENRISSRSEAIRRLTQLGVAVSSVNVEQTATIMKGFNAVYERLSKLTKELGFPQSSYKELTMGLEVAETNRDFRQVIIQYHNAVFRENLISRVVSVVDMSKITDFANTIRSLKDDTVSKLRGDVIAAEEATDLTAGDRPT